MNNFLKEQEAKAVRLVEERGVAAFPYRTVLQQILDWCQTQTAGMKPGDTKNFIVPNEMTSKIDFVRNLRIEVNVRDGENYSYHSGGGNLVVTWADTIVDGKYNYGKIFINAYSYYGNIYERTILNSLNHELNHFYEAWKELSSTRSMRLFAKKSIKANPNITCLEDAFNTKANQIIYRLYSETELNALVAGVYGDLAGIKSVRQNFKKDLQHVSAYNLYGKMYMDLDDLIFYFQNMHPEHVKPFILELQKLGIELNPYYKNDQGFIKEFGRRTKFLLKTLIRGIGKAASLYYDSKEVPEDNIEIKTRN